MSHPPETWQFGNARIVVLEDTHPMARPAPPGLGRVANDAPIMFIRRKDWPTLRSWIDYRAFMHRILPGVYPTPHKLTKVVRQ